MPSMTTTGKTLPFSKREQQKLERFASRKEARDAQADRCIWFDTVGLGSPNDADALFLRALRTVYSGIMLHAGTLDAFARIIPDTFLKIVNVDDCPTLAEIAAHEHLVGPRLVIASADAAVLKEATSLGLPTCLRVYVDDAASLHMAIDKGRLHAYLMIRFRDPTNIPLELVIASLQSTGTVLIKEINTEVDAEDAVVSLGVMEVGADGVMYSPRTHRDLDSFLQRLAPPAGDPLPLKAATIVQTKAVGMGYRSCIDLATLFEPSEGMLIGSTSHGGILACPEVFFLPYMELRPFRVNAGGVHSYVYASENRTQYMTELSAGSQVMIVALDGRTRTAPVGRMKTEVRPLRLIEAEFEDGTRINVLMQDDWHVRVFSTEGQPLNITELKPGDKVMAYQAAPGRHVGIKIDENIKEQ